MVVRSTLNEWIGSVACSLMVLMASRTPSGVVWFEYGWLMCHTCCGLCLKSTWYVILGSFICRWWCQSGVLYPVQFGAGQLPIQTRHSKYGWYPNRDSLNSPGRDGQGVPAGMVWMQAPLMVLIVRALFIGIPFDFTTAPNDIRSIVIKVFDGRHFIHVVFKDINE